MVKGTKTVLSYCQRDGDVTNICRQLGTIPQWENVCRRDMHAAESIADKVRTKESPQYQSDLTSSVVAWLETRKLLAHDSQRVGNTTFFKKWLCIVWKTIWTHTFFCYKKKTYDVEKVAAPFDGEEHVTMRLHRQHVTTMRRIAIKPFRSETVSAPQKHVVNTLTASISVTSTEKDKASKQIQNLFFWVVVVSCQNSVISHF